MTRPFIIDTDTASDDAVALIMALRWPGVDVKAITLVSGNVPIDQGVRNALYTAEVCGVEVPVYRGADRPLVRPAAHAEWFHGKDGMGDQNYPPPRGKAQTGHAVDVLIETINANPGIVLVTLGPLTNVALALRRAPEIVKNVSRCVVMGGAACTYGNVTPVAEYNIWCDPEAARIVFLSGLPVEMVGWEHCIGPHALNEDEIAYVKGFDTPMAHLAIDCNIVAKEAFLRQTGEQGISLPDPVAMSIALDPTIALRTSKHYVDVEVNSDLTRGMTVVDRLNVASNRRNNAIWGELLAGEPNVSVVWEIDILRWKEALYSVLR